MKLEDHRAFLIITGARGLITDDLVGLKESPPVVNGYTVYYWLHASDVNELDMPSCVITDWGDGTTTIDRIEGTYLFDPVEHTYSGEGEYVISAFFAKGSSITDNQIELVHMCAPVTCMVKIGGS